MSSSWIFLSVLALVCIATGLNVVPERDNDIMVPMVGMVTKEDITPYPADSYYSLRTDDIEVGFPKDIAEFEVAEHNVSRANEVFKVDFLTIAEVRTNGSFVTKPLSLDDGRWRNLKDQGGIVVREYTTHVFARRRVVEVSIIVAISRNESTFSSTYGDTKLSKNQIKFSINVEDWPFESSDNFLNVTMAAASTKHNSSQYNTEKNSVNWAEFGDVENSDAHVLHIAFESTVIVDDKKTDNVTVYLDKDDNTITISLPHHDSFVFYDPVISLQEPESSSSNHTVLIVVLCIIGAIVLLVILAVIGFFIYRKRRSNYEVIE